MHTRSFGANNMAFDVSLKRICFFCFYDKEGIVDDYILFYLKALKRLKIELIIVCNGLLKQNGKTDLEKFADCIIIRENQGFDAWAHKAAIEHIGWDQLENYDEVLITNATIMGPVTPLEDMFDSMESRQLDFWGITKHLSFQKNPFNCKYGYTPEHLQSYFIVFRKNVVQSIEFKNFWRELSPLYTYNEAVGKYEMVLTKTLSDAGFTYDSFVNADKYAAYTKQAIADYPVKIIEDDGCPFFKRRMFFNDYSVPLNSNAGQQSVMLYRYLSRSQIFNMEMFWKNMLRTCHISDLIRNIGLVYILPKQKENSGNIVKKTVFAMHLYYEDLFEKYLSFIKNFPADTDVLITTNTDAKKEIIAQVLNKYDHSKRSIRLLKVINKGRDMSALWIAMKDILVKYDYVCFIHDKKTMQISPGTVGDSWGYKLLQNTIGTKELIKSVINCFDTEEHLGLLVPPAPIHGQYLKFAQNVWTVNFSNTKALAEKLGINVPMEDDKDPVSAIGNCFWFKTKALSQLFEHTWNYQDFSAEPLPEDGSISHAIERIYSFAAQDNGYYTGILMENSYAEIEYLNLEYYLKNGYVSTENSKYTKYLEREVRKYYKQTSLKWQITHRFCKLLGLKEKPLDLDS
jgi:lipopolysaccharide biosynthesis protein